MDWLIDDASHDNPGFSLARMVVLAGKCSDHHKHQLCHEAISATHGMCTVILGNHKIVIHAGQTLYVPKDTPHAIDNTGGHNNVELLITYSAGTRDYHSTA